MTSYRKYVKGIHHEKSRNLRMGFFLSFGRNNNLAVFIHKLLIKVNTKSLEHIFLSNKTTLTIKNKTHRLKDRSSP